APVARRNAQPLMSKTRLRLLARPWIVGVGGFAAIIVLAFAVARVTRAPGAAAQRSPAPGVQIPRPRAIVPAARLALYAGSARCAGCHPTQAIQQASRHAHTLSRTDARLHGGWFRGGT